MRPVYLIDASIYIFRSYFAIPNQWYSEDGYELNAVYGYTQFILRLLETAKPTKIAAAYDESLGSCFRNEIFPAYKSSRELPDESLAFQLQACKNLTQLMGIASPASSRYEADDIIATLSRTAREQGDFIAIVTRDKDLAQLLQNSQDFIWDYSADKRIGKTDFFENYGVMPEQLEDYLALVGDSVDDIPGVPGIGKKTAAALLQQFGSVDKLFSDLSSVENSEIRGAKRIVDKLGENREQVYISKQLARLDSDVENFLNLSIDWQPPEKEIIQNYLENIGLGTTFHRRLDTAYWSK